MNSYQLPLTVIIVTDRVDTRFRRCLKSVRQAAEIVVVSYNSNIKWRNWREEFHFKLIEKESELKDFSVARNQALAEASQEWILFLDSDEWLDQSSLPLIKEVLIKPEFNGIKIWRRDIFHHRPLNWGEVYQVRLTRLARRQMIHFNRPVHEIAEVKGTVVSSRIIVWHESHPDLAEFLRSVNFYAQKEAEFRLKQGQHFSFFELIFYPWVKWLRNMCFKLGFLDGWRGVAYSTMMSIHSLLVRIHLYELEISH